MREELTNEEKDRAQILIWAAEIRRRGHPDWAEMIVEQMLKGNMNYAKALLLEAQKIS